MNEIRWDVLTIGWLSRNRYWGESDDRAYRPATCTSVLLRAGDRTIVVDPSLPPAEMPALLDRRAGISPADVDAVFLTHFHGDHRAGIGAFPDAQWLMPALEIALWDGRLAPDGPDRAVLARLRPSGDELAEGIEILPTPGHTATHSSLLFGSGGLRVAVAADAAMTRDFFLARDYYFNTEDPEAAVASIDSIAAVADIVVPGHDNYFLVRTDGAAPGVPER